MRTRRSVEKQFFWYPAHRFSEPILEFAVRFVEFISPAEVFLDLFLKNLEIGFCLFFRCKQNQRKNLYVCMY